MRGRGSRSDWIGHGCTWLAAGALAMNLVLIVGLLVLIASNGLGYFWQPELLELELDDGEVVLGEVYGREQIPSAADGGGEGLMRVRLKTGNRDLTGLDFRWIDESRIRSTGRPREAVVLERVEWGDFFGFVVELRDSGSRLRGEEIWERLPDLLDEKRGQRSVIRRLENRDIGDVNWQLERLRLEERRLGLRSLSEQERARRRAELDGAMAVERERYALLIEELDGLRRSFDAETLALATADGTQRQIQVSHVLRVLRPNALGTADRVLLYLARLWEFVAGEPRESNTEGGIFPAIFGTVMMVFLMSIAVVPFGVLAAIYMHEYAREGLFLRIVRIAVNNLAGVPSIVFGVFGLGFFVYIVGGSLDRLFYSEALPAPTFGTGGILWASLTLALLTVPVVIVATEEGLAAVPLALREGSLALGATRFETIRRVVLPASAPGILTGVILAVGRAAGEVAPLMIVGMVKLAPALPIDHHLPWVHLERKFMHLGFHIYDLAFQSPNVEATKPLVFATALLLILVVLTTNLAAISLRNYLRRRYASSSI